MMADIQHRKFNVKDIPKLTADFAADSNEVPELKSMNQLIKSFEVFCQIVCVLAPAPVQHPLQLAMALYRIRLLNMVGMSTFSSVQGFHIELTVPASKTDPFRKGVTIPVAGSNDAACPTSSLRHLFTAFPAPPGAPLFEPVRGEAFSASMITQALRSILSNQGLKSHYSGHSFRRGAATEARNAGLPDSTIQLLGRWKSDSCKLYVVTNREFLLQASRHLQGL